MKILKKYRKKPVVVEAIRWDGDSSLANSVLGESYAVDWEYESSNSLGIYIPTLEGAMLCKIGDWIVKGIKGEFYPVKDDIFGATYEEAE